MKILNYLFAAFVLIGLFTVGCTEEEPEALEIGTIQAIGTSFEDGSNITSDLNGASSANDVALNAVINITMNKEVDASTVNANNVSLASDNGDIATSVSSSGSTITVDPENFLTRGTQFTLNLAGLKAIDGGAFFATSRTFRTEGRAPVIVPNEGDQIAYWNFDNSADDIIGSFDPDNVVAIEYGTDRFGQGSSTATFDGDESIIEVPNGDQLMASDDFTLSFWMKTNTNGHVNQDGNPSSNFVMGLGAFFGFQFEMPADFGSCKLAMSYELENGDKESEDLWFNGSGEDKDNGGWQGWDFVANIGGAEGVAGLLKDKWVNIICTYNAETKQAAMYINGELMKSQDFDLWPDEAPKRTVKGVTYRGNETDVEPILAFGFIKSIDSPMWADTPWGDYNKPTSNHFKGDLDDVRIFKKAFSADDAETLYNSEK
jgi:hypothetical protein